MLTRTILAIQVHRIVAIRMNGSQEIGLVDFQRCQLVIGANLNVNSDHFSR